MSVVAFSEVRSHLTDIVNEVAYGGDRVVITRKGKEMVAIVSLEDLELLEELEERVDLDLARKALKDAEKNGTISWKKAKKELGL